MSGPWESSDVPRGHAYDRRFEDLAAAGMDMHGEAALVASFAPGVGARCGVRHREGGDRAQPAWPRRRRGRRRRGHARGRPRQGARPHLGARRPGRPRPGARAAGPSTSSSWPATCLIFVAARHRRPGHRQRGPLAAPGGLLVTGYSLRPDGFGPGRHDTLAAAFGPGPAGSLVDVGQAPLRARRPLRRGGASAGDLSRALRAHATEQQLCGPPVH